MITRYGYRVLKTKDMDLHKIRRDLVVSPDKGDYGKPITYNLYRESEKFLYVPRHYGKEAFGPAEYRRSPSVDTLLCFQGSLRSETHQHQASEACVRGLREDGCCVLSLPTGFGKTTVALHVLSHMRTRTLIVVHKEFLMTQWKARIQQFLPEARIGTIRGKVLDIEDKDIVVCMLQSLSTKDYPFDPYCFGLTIIDETHHICAKSFSNMLFKIQTRYMLGLSATLERRDGLSYALHWFLGDTAYEVTRENKADTMVQVIQLSVEKPFPRTKMGTLNIPEAITMLTTFPKRNQIILDKVEELLRDSRKVLILSDRRSHCETLLQDLDAMGVSAGLYIGGMKPKDLQESELRDVIIGTYSLANEGLDIPTLDTVLFATPKSDVVQASGRVMRETPGKKNNPLIIDIVDNWEVFEYQYYKRRKYYTSSGFTVRKSTGNKN